MPVARSPVLYALVILLFPVLADAQTLYRWVDENGITHFSDKEPESGAQRVSPSGMSVIAMGENIRTQKRLENIRRPKPAEPPKPPTAQPTSSRPYWEEYHKKRQAELLQWKCDNYVARIDWIDSRLRAGGYSVSQGNRWRGERRELSSKRAWECLRNN
ncbi:protein of unknown function [Marinobacter gudaonensis]|uniref:DUF4124 domain-containing protein n=1 Tax=Marinobacter gudaonensis TaxID=375760 RepID=A0A1I6H9E9_9GAMM|nr:protein of unknown function [Marinobacter gudaonensis]